MSVNEKMTAIADAIRSKTGETAPLSLDDMALEIPKVHAAGYTKAESDFWDAYQKKGARTTYQNAFVSEGWNDTTFKPKYDLIPTNASTMFDTCHVTDLVTALEKAGVVLDLSNATRTNGMFQLCKSTRLPVLDISLSTNTASMFYANTTTKWVEKLIVSETTDLTNTGNCFAGAYALEHIIFEGVIRQSFKINWCPLDKESILSILNCLKDYKDSGTTYTLTLGATNLAKLTDGEKAIATQKGWSLA